MYNIMWVLAPWLELWIRKDYKVYHFALYPDGQGK